MFLLVNTLGHYMLINDYDEVLNCVFSVFVKFYRMFFLANTIQTQRNFMFCKIDVSMIPNGLISIILMTSDCLENYAIYTEAAKIKWSRSIQIIALYIVKVISMLKNSKSFCALAAA